MTTRALILSIILSLIFTVNSYSDGKSPLRITIYPTIINKNVTGITYDSHDTMVIKSFEEIYNEVDQKLKIKDKAVYIEHVKGYLGLGEVSIIIAVACPHRAETYILSRYIIEEIKKRSPIWKKEHYENEESEWLKGNPIANEKI